MIRAALAWLALAGIAEAQSGSCFQRDQLEVALTEKYQEYQLGMGLTSVTEILEVWVSDETGTFTIFITHINGVSCVVDSGQSWTTNPSPEAEPEGEAH